MSDWLILLFLYVSDGWPDFKVVAPVSMHNCCRVVLDCALFFADGTVLCAAAFPLVVYVML